jgi:hypothetical protein
MGLHDMDADGRQTDDLDERAGQPAPSSGFR